MQAEIQQALKTSNSESVKASASNPVVVARIVELITASLEMGKGGLGGIVFGAATKVGVLADFAGDNANSKTYKASVAASKTLLMSVNLIRLNPETAVATIGATFLKKVALMMDLAGEDERKAQIIAALMDLAGQAIVTGIAGVEVTAIVGGTGGLGAGLAIPIAIANGAALCAAAWKAWEVCTSNPTTAAR
jgi:hypothetical protein